MELNKIFSTEELIIIRMALADEKQLYKIEIEHLKSQSKKDKKTVDIIKKYKKNIEIIENIVRKFE